VSNKRERRTGDAVRTPDTVADTLKQHASELHDFGVRSLAVFGSVARREASSASDVDLLIEFDRPVGLFHFFRVQHFLEDVLGVSHVDLVMPGAVRPAYREEILREAVRVA